MEILTSKDIKVKNILIFFELHMLNLANLCPLYATASSRENKTPLL